MVAPHAAMSTEALRVVTMTITQLASQLMDRSRTTPVDTVARMSRPTTKAAATNNLPEAAVTSSPRALAMAATPILARTGTSPPPPAMVATKVALQAVTDRLDMEMTREAAPAMETTSPAQPSTDPLATAMSPDANGHLSAGGITVGVMSTATATPPTCLVASEEKSRMVTAAGGTMVMSMAALDTATLAMVETAVAMAPGTSAVCVVDEVR
jgi:hypothetical protein